MDNTLIEQLVLAIADREDTAPTDLDVAIEDHVSTGGIQSLVEHKSDSWRLQFETPAHVVEISGSNTITVDGETQRQFSW
jgi:hypothetical protein